ncbi:MAG: PorT family protein [Bacteroidales bacterium]|nr:PorT family protein [Bacteroidales bacterium]
MKRFLCILALALVTLGGFAQTQKVTQSKTTPKTTQTTQKSAQTKAKTATTQTKSATTQTKTTAKSAQTQAKSATTQTKSAAKTTQTQTKSATAQKSAANQKTSQKSAQDKKKEQEKKDKQKEKEKDKTRFGLTGGIGLHTYKSHHVAFQAKLGGDVRFPVLVDGLYALAGGRLAYRTCGTQYTGRMSNLYLEVPLNLGYTFDLSDNFGLFAEAGPYMGLILAKLNYEYDHNNCGFRPIDIGIGLNLGVEMMKSIRLSLGFDYGFISPCGSDHAHNGGIWLTGTYLF